jgi:hypothetical protein
MHNRVGRGLLVLSAVLALVMVGPATTASADTIVTGDRVCSMYVNSVGFGAYCSSGQANPLAGPPPTWGDKLAGRPFVPCRDFPIPAGVHLPPAPEGKTWAFRMTIVGYRLDSYNGGRDAHLERAYVAVSQAERDQCPFPDYMKQFWWQFEGNYPPPELVIMPTFTPRVNVPAYFSLTRDSSLVVKEKVAPDELLSGLYDESHNLSMRGLVAALKIDPGDGTAPFDCLMGVAALDDPDGYDQTQDPNHQMNTCKHVYTKSSASQPDGMYTVKLTITW